VIMGIIAARARLHPIPRVAREMSFGPNTKPETTRFGGGHLDAAASLSASSTPAGGFDHRTDPDRGGALMADLRRWAIALGLPDGDLWNQDAVGWACRNGDILDPPGRYQAFDQDQYWRLRDRLRHRLGDLLWAMAWPSGATDISR